MFVDKVNIVARAGNGGNGIISFRHEKFVDKGGPDGGDGGRGGDVILIADHSQNTLANFRYKKTIQAEPGQSGGKRKKRGKSGKNSLEKVPLGTVVYDDLGNLLADLSSQDTQFLVAKGGKGGFGNAHFVSSRRQVPKIAEKGESGEVAELTLELKMIADVGIVGLPNAGKSTLLSVISSAKPEIANYAFTTLVPNLGVVDIDGEHSLLFADIPGLIDGASEGKGLGDEFLRHIERTNVLLHLIDAYNEPIGPAYKTIISELKAYKTDLSKLPQIVVLTKTEGLDKDIISYQMAELKKLTPKSTKIMAISAMSGDGIKELLRETYKLVQNQKSKIKSKSAKKETTIINLVEKDEDWHITKTTYGYTVVGKKIERFASMADINSESGQQRILDIMKKIGILSELKRQGLEPGQKIHIGKAQKYKLNY